VPDRDLGPPVMTEVLVVADDLTGGNATGALFARRGLRTVTVSDVAHAGRHAADVVVVNTQTRHVSAELAAAAVRRAVEAVPGARLMVKRVDTTLRGNVGAELEAALTIVRRRWPTARALFVPAYPAADRTTVDGIHLIDGVPVAETDAGRDPFRPVRTSRPAELLRAQTRLSASEITLATVRAGQDVLARALEEAGAADIVICDAVTTADLTALADAAAERVWLSVDSGPFGAALAAAKGIGGTPKPVVIIAGSATGRTHEQLARTERVLGARFVNLHPDDLDPGGLHRGLAALLADTAIAGIRVARGPMDAGLAAEITGTLGEVARRVIASQRVGGVYATGGDVSAAVVDALGAEGFAVETEVRPLAVAGRLVGGPNHGLPFAAKGGLIGDVGAAVDCVEHLRLVSATEPSSHRDT
jgi:D-threonate/D-erythronate kinase